MLNSLQTLFKLKQDKRGATAIEYALIAGLLAVAIIAGVGFLTTGLDTAFTNIASTITSASK